MSLIFNFVDNHTQGCHNFQFVQSALYERLKDFSDQIKEDGVYLQGSLKSLSQYVIEEVVVGLNYVAFRLQDGRVCRVSYTIKPEKSYTKGEKAQRRLSKGVLDKLVNLSSGTTRSNSNQNDTGQQKTFPRSVDGSCISQSTTSRSNISNRMARYQILSNHSTPRVSFIREMQRQGIYLARTFTTPIAASEVPDDVIEQCQTVLQGKSRQLIIRELQRTNLDVNMAVNNLLSRDDEADENGGAAVADDWEETDDLLSLLDHADNPLFEAAIGESALGIPDDIFPSIRLRRETLYPTLGSDIESYADRRKRRRLDCQLRSNGDSVHRSFSDSYGNRSGNESPSLSTDDNAKTESATIRKNCLVFGNNLEFWKESNNSGKRKELRFLKISGMYSELVGITVDFELHQWRWSDSEPWCSEKNGPDVSSMFWSTHSSVNNNATITNNDIYYHPRIPSLNLSNEKIIKLSTSSTRATILTSSGKLATWVDEMIAPIFQVLRNSDQSCTAQNLKIEHPAINFLELREENINDIYVSSLVSAVKCGSGNIYWWGVIPFKYRKTAIEKNRERMPTDEEKHGVQSDTRKNKTDPLQIVPGSFVCMKNAPIFHAGAIGLIVVGGVPKVGTLLEDAWKVEDVCRFSVKPVQSIVSERRNSQMSSTMNSTTVNLASFDPATHEHTCPQLNTSFLYGLLGGGSSNGIGQSINSNTGKQVTVPESGNNQNNIEGINIQNSNHKSSTSWAEMPPPPSPASSTCSDQSGPVKISPGTFKRKKQSISSSYAGDLINEVNTESRPSINTRGQKTRYSDSYSSNLDYEPIAGQKRALTPDENSNSSKHSAYSQIEEEEDWCLKDVIFLEDGRTQPVGVVLKVDGSIAAVKFLKDSERACAAVNCPYSPLAAVFGNSSSVCNDNNSGSDPISWLNDCRLLRKDELVVVKQPLVSRVPDVVQKFPKCIPFEFFMDGKTSNNNNCLNFGIVGMAIENEIIHLLLRKPNTPKFVEYKMVSLTKKVISSNKLSTAASGFFGKTVPSIAGPLDSDYCELKNGSAFNVERHKPLFIRDGNGTVYPILFNDNHLGTNQTSANTELIPSPQWVDLPPVRCVDFNVITMGNQKSSTLLGSDAKAANKPKQCQLLICFVIVESQNLMHCILRAEYQRVSYVLDNFSILSDQDSFVQKILSEKLDGQRNILHAAINMCEATSNHEVQWKLSNNLIYRSKKSNNINNSGGSIIEDLSQRANWSVEQSMSLSLPYRRWKECLETSRQQIDNGHGYSYSRSSGRHSPTVRFTVMSSANQTRSMGTGDTANSNGWIYPPIRLDEKEKRINSYRIVNLLINHLNLDKYLVNLLSQKNSDGLTPFMLAIVQRLYPIALFLLDCILDICDTQSVSVHNPKSQLALSMLFPAASVVAASGNNNSNENSDNTSNASIFLEDNPIQILCQNDGCSFTWTGPDHIRQDIFECRTCGLTESFCCCTECARICHKGHDCHLKKTSPTAYCDCWEKCRCRALIIGDNNARLELLKKLLACTDFATLQNRKKEHILLFLVKTADRQIREQKQIRNSSRRHPVEQSLSGRNKLANQPVLDPQMPEHGFEPYIFALIALDIVLGNWSAVETLFLMGDKTDLFRNMVKTLNLQKESNGVNPYSDDDVFLNYQSFSEHLDQFVFTLITKIPSPTVDILLNTINKQFHSNKTLKPYNSIKNVASRFIRSVARVFVTLQLQMAPDYSRKRQSTRLSGSFHVYSAQTRPLEICKKIFESLLFISLTELPRIAGDIIAPVRCGLIKPTSNYNYCYQITDAIRNLDQIFQTNYVNVEKTSQIKNLADGKIRNNIANDHNYQSSLSNSRRNYISSRRSGNNSVNEINREREMMGGNNGSAGGNIGSRLSHYRRRHGNDDMDGNSGGVTNSVSDNVIDGEMEGQQRLSTVGSTGAVGNINATSVSVSSSSGVDSSAIEQHNQHQRCTRERHRGNDDGGSISARTHSNRMSSGIEPNTIIEDDDEETGQSSGEENWNANDTNDATVINSNVTNDSRGTHSQLNTLYLEESDGDGNTIGEHDLEADVDMEIYDEDHDDTDIVPETESESDDSISSSICVTIERMETDRNDAAHPYDEHSNTITPKNEETERNGGGPTNRFDQSNTVSNGNEEHHQEIISIKPNEDSVNGEGFTMSNMDVRTRINSEREPNSRIEEIEVSNNAGNNSNSNNLAMGETTSVTTSNVGVSSTSQSTVADSAMSLRMGNAPPEWFRGQVDLDAISEDDSEDEDDSSQNTEDEEPVSVTTNTGEMHQRNSNRLHAQYHNSSNSSHHHGSSTSTAPNENYSNLNNQQQQQQQRHSSSLGPSLLESNESLLAEEGNISSAHISGSHWGVQTTQVHLSRAFGHLIKLIASLLSYMYNSRNKNSGLNYNDCSSVRDIYSNTIGNVVISQEEEEVVLMELSHQLGPVWTWVCQCMDFLESQVCFSFAYQRKHKLFKAKPVLKFDVLNSSGNVGNDVHFLNNINDANSTHGSLGNNGSNSGGGSITQSESTGASRIDILKYIISIMRTSADEHGDQIPMNLYSVDYCHLAYLVDSLLYLTRVCSGLPTATMGMNIGGGDSTITTAMDTTADSPGMNGNANNLSVMTSSSEDQHQLISDSSTLKREPTLASTEDMEEEQEDLNSLRPTIGSEYGDSMVEDDLCPSVSINYSSDNNKSKLHFGVGQVNQPQKLNTAEDTFFVRSDFPLGWLGVGANSFRTSVSESLPLAHMPQLLQPPGPSDEVFGILRRFDSLPHFTNTLNNNTNRGYNGSLPLHMGFNSRWADQFISDSNKIMFGTVPLTNLRTRWRYSLELLSNSFENSVGAEPGSVLAEFSHFSVKETRFRKEMERLRNQCRRDLSLIVSREWESLLCDTMGQLAQEYNRRGVISSAATTVSSNSCNNSNNLPALLCHRFKVKFTDEPGEGNGVARSFLTVFAECVTNERPLSIGVFACAAGLCSGSHMPSSNGPRKLPRVYGNRNNSEHVNYTRLSSVPTRSVSSSTSNLNGNGVSQLRSVVSTSSNTSNSVTPSSSRVTTMMRIVTSNSAPPPPPHHQNQDSATIMSAFAIFASSNSTSTPSTTPYYSLTPIIATTGNGSIVSRRSSRIPNLTQPQSSSLPTPPAYSEISHPLPPSTPASVGYSNNTSQITSIDAANLAANFTANLGTHSPIWVSSNWLPIQSNHGSSTISTLSNSLRRRTQMPLLAAAVSTNQHQQQSQSQSQSQSQPQPQSQQPISLSSSSVVNTSESHTPSVTTASTSVNPQYIIEMLRNKNPLITDNLYSYSQNTLLRSNNNNSNSLENSTHSEVYNYYNNNNNNNNNSLSSNQANLTVYELLRNWFNVDEALLHNMTVSITSLIGRSDMHGLILQLAAETIRTSDIASCIAGQYSRYHESQCQEKNSNERSNSEISTSQSPELNVEVAIMTFSAHLESLVQSLKQQNQQTNAQIQQKFTSAGINNSNNVTDAQSNEGTNNCSGIRNCSLDPELAPLFWQPGHADYYSPRRTAPPTIDDVYSEVKGSTGVSVTNQSAARNNLYRCVGRVIGITLLMNETMPLKLSRHVLKYILGLPISWHDFAFFNCQLYESLRQLMQSALEAQQLGVAGTRDDPLLEYNLNFTLTPRAEEGGGNVDGLGTNSAVSAISLVHGGDEMDVHSNNVFQYVKYYCLSRMVSLVKPQLDQIKYGVYDVLPRNALSGLSPEDLRLLLNGTDEINVDVLISYTSFLDESSLSMNNSQDRVARFKKWFWQVVRSFTSVQRQNLLYFWTSSPALPASNQGFQPMPSITVRPADDIHLPTANTCISRLYIPLYSTKQILRDKLLQAIETKSFGFV